MRGRSLPFVGDFVDDGVPQQNWISAFRVGAIGAAQGTVSGDDHIARLTKTDQICVDEVRVDSCFNENYVRDYKSNVNNFT